MSEPTKPPPCVEPRDIVRLVTISRMAAAQEDPAWVREWLQRLKRDLDAQFREPRP